MMHRSFKSNKAAANETRQQGQEPPAEPKNGQLSRDDSVLYLTTLAIVIMGVWGVWLALDNAPIAMFLLIFVFIGFASSLRLRNTREPVLATLLFMGGILGLLLLLRITGLDLLRIMVPDLMALSEATLFSVAAMGIILAMVCFLLITRQALIFSIIPVLAIFGLIATLLEAKVIFVFLLFLLASLFLLGYEYILRLKEEAGLRLPRAQARQLPRSQFLISSGFFAGVVLIGLIISLFLTVVLSSDTLQGFLDALSGWPQMIADSSSSFNEYRPTTTRSEVPSDYRVGRGPITLGEEPVMYVESNSAELWRERVFDFYTGRGWQRSNTTTEEVDLNANKASLAKFVPQGQSTREIVQTFRLLKSISKEIPVAAQPYSVEFTTSGLSRISIDAYGCLQTAGHNLQSGDEYKAISVAPSIRRRDPSIRLDSVELRQYLQVPWQTRKIWELVNNDLLSKPSTTEEKIMKLLAFLQSGNYRYTLSPPAVPQDEDAAVYFIFESKEGYCDLFATSFVIMCRAAGIPSRLAVGYGEGTPDPETGMFLVKESDAHAWVEVFIEEQGWVTIDPTPAALSEEEKEDKPPFWSKWRVQVSTWFVAALLCTVGFVGAFKYLLFDPWLQRRRWERRLWAQMSGRIAIFYSRMCALLAKQGLLRKAWMTPKEYLESLNNQPEKMGEAYDAAKELTQLFITSRYGADETQPETATAAQNAFLRLKRTLPRITRKHPSRDKRN